MIVKFLDKLFGFEKGKKEAATIHERSMQDIKETAEKIHEMNKILVKRSVAYKIYIATGRKDV
jgi:hypothetical protein